MRTMICLFLLFLCHLAVAREFAPGFYVSIGRSYDDLLPFSELIKSRPERALHLIKNLHITSMGIPMDDPPARKLEAYQLLAQNPGLPWAVDAELARIPELVEDHPKRQDVIRGLSNLPAEWSVRKLAALARQELIIRSEIYDLTDPQVLGNRMMADPGFSPVGRSTPGLAVSALRQMNLPGWLDTLDSQVPMQMLGSKDSHHNAILRVARWIELNEHRIPEMVRQKWGDLAVTNADVGLGPDNLPLAQDGTSPTRSRQSKRPSKSGADHETTGSADKRPLKVATAGALTSVAGLLGWLYWRRRMLKAC
jgi:hypothetical protein